MYDVILYPSGELAGGMIIHAAAPQHRARRLASGSVVDADNAISSCYYIFAPCLWPPATGEGQLVA